MKKVLFYLLAFLMGGCVQSLHPLFTEDEIIFEEKLIGTWYEDPNSKEMWNFKKADPNTYELIYTDSDGKKGQFQAALGKLDNMMFLNLYPAEAEMEENDFYKWHLLPTHSFMKIDRIEPTLQMRAMDYDNLAEKLKENPDLIKHEKLEIQDDRIILTASTKELQQFIIKYAKTEGAFDDASNLTKAQPRPWWTSSPDSNALEKIDPNAAPIDPNNYSAD